MNLTVVIKINLVKHEYISQKNNVPIESIKWWKMFDSRTAKKLTEF